MGTIFLASLRVIQITIQALLILLLKLTGGWQKNRLKCKTVSALCSRSRTARRNAFRQCHRARKSTYCLWQLLLPGHFFFSLHTKNITSSLQSLPKVLMRLKLFPILIPNKKIWRISRKDWHNCAQLRN